MGGPGWTDAAFAAVLVVTTGYCAAHLIRHRTEVDVGVVELAMGGVMIAMLLGTVPVGGARTIGLTGFAAAAAWFALRASARMPEQVSARRSAGRFGGGAVTLRGPRDTLTQPGLLCLLCAAMVVMLAAGPMAPMTGQSMSAPSAAGGTSHVVQLLALTLLIALAVGFGRDGHRLLRPGAGVLCAARLPVACRLAMVTTSAWMLAGLVA